MTDTDTSAEIVRKLIAETRSIPDTLPQWRKGDPVWLVRVRWWMPRMANVAEALLDQREAMLAACAPLQEAEVWVKAVQDDDVVIISGKTFNAIRAAIAKAEGRTL